MLVSEGYRDSLIGYTHLYLTGDTVFKMLRFVGDRPISLGETILSKKSGL